MDLAEDERSILLGERGETLRKALTAVVRYGELFDADRLVPVSAAPHFITSFGAGVIAPYFEMVDELIAAGLRTPRPFTVDPRPTDPAAVRYGPLEALANRLIYGRQRRYEGQLARLGLRDRKAFTCTCYLPEVGNIPRRNEVLAWSESSAVAFANSVLGARTNRNSAGIDLLCNLVGKAPLFGLLTEEGRKAGWRVEVTTDRLPDPQVLGGAIGARVLDGVPYIIGLERFLGSGAPDTARDYLKDMGAAAAASGAVGLFHVEGITPEAIEVGRALLGTSPSSYRVDETELERARSAYPLLWKHPNARPRLCLIGCPHLSVEQLRWWAQKVPQRVQVPTVFCAAPQVVETFRAAGGDCGRLLATGARLASLCPLMYMTNPLCSRKPVITNSNKLRVYSTARFYADDEILRILGAAP